MVVTSSVSTTAPTSLERETSATVLRLGSEVVNVLRNMCRREDELVACRIAFSIV